MPGVDETMSNHLGEVVCVLASGRRGPEPVLGGVEDDGGHGDLRLAGDAFLSQFVSRVSGGEPVPVPIAVHDNLDEIGVLERSDRRGVLIVGK